ncbi:MAG: phosphoribosyltransferase family protein [Candidatus Hydrothermarchaeota archaeon]
MNETHLESIKQRIRAVELLKLMKNSFTYEELSERTNIPITVLNRYVKGHVLPSHERAMWLLKSLEKEFDIRKEVLKRIKFDEHGFFDNTQVLTDSLLLKKIAEEVKEIFSDVTVDKVLTAAIDGIPIAMQVANEFGVDLIYTKKNREVGVYDFMEETYLSSSSGVIMSLYIPSWMIKKGENILVVDDIIRSGETQGALIRLVNKAKANVVGVFTIISIEGEGLSKISKEVNCKVVSLVTL